jgi:hypothetical protein
MGGRSIARPLLFATIVAASVVSAACNPIVGPSQPDANWRAVERGRFTFYVRPGSFAEQNVSALNTVLEDQYEHTVEVLRLRYAGRISAFLYESAEDADLESFRSGTAYTVTESFRAVCTAPVDETLYALLAHEANHVIINNGWGRPGTAFAAEGMASAVLSETHHQLGRHYLFSWTRREAANIPSLSALADDSRWEGFNQSKAYDASASFQAYLLERDGPDRLRQLYGVSSGEFEARFSQIYGRPLAQAEREWKEFSAGWGG